MAIGLGYKEALKKGPVEAKLVIDIPFYLILSGLVGARLFYVVSNYPRYLEHPLDIFKIWEGGMLFYGALIFIFFTALWFFRKKTLPVWDTLDLIAPSIVLFQVFLRLGCFAAGCCFGTPTSLPWGVTFNHPACPAPPGIPLHPTQLYESLTVLIILFVLYLIKDRKRFPGQILVSYLFLYGVARWALEFFRGDKRGFHISGNWSDMQYVSIVVVFSSLILGFYLKQKNSQSPLVIIKEGD